MVGWLSGFRAQAVSVAYWSYTTFVGHLVGAAATGGGREGCAPTLHLIPWHLPYNSGKSRKTSLRVTEWEFRWSEWALLFRSPAVQSALPLAGWQSW